MRTSAPALLSNDSPPVSSTCPFRSKVIDWIIASPQAFEVGGPLTRREFPSRRGTFYVLQSRGLEHAGQRIQIERPRDPVPIAPDSTPLQPPVRGQRRLSSPSTSVRIGFSAGALRGFG